MEASQMGGSQVKPHHPPGSPPTPSTGGSPGYTGDFPGYLPTGQHAQAVHLRRQISGSKLLLATSRCSSWGSACSQPRANKPMQSRGKNKVGENPCHLQDWLCSSLSCSYSCLPIFLHPSMRLPLSPCKTTIGTEMD